MSHNPEDFRILQQRDRENETFPEAVSYIHTAAKDKLRALDKILELSTETVEGYLQVLKDHHQAKLLTLSPDDKIEYSKYCEAIPITYYDPNKRIMIKPSEALNKMIDDEEEMYVHREGMRRGLSEMILVYLIIIFEEYISNLLISLFRKQPEILKPSEKGVTYKEAFRCKSLSELLTSIGQKVVESQVGSNIEDLGAYLNKPHGLDLKKREDWNQFKEYFYRRHVVVHNYGIPDHKYIERTGYTGAIQWLEVSKDYLETGFNIFNSYIDLLTAHFMEKHGKNAETS